MSASNFERPAAVRRWGVIVVFVLTLLLSLLTRSAQAFAGPAPAGVAAFRRSRLSLRAQQSDEGYGPFGSLTRQGPVPFFIRLARPETYEAAVVKYMKGEQCSRIEAMANMDAYFQDPNGWAGQKLRERKGQAAKLDYANANQNPSSLALTAVWAAGITSLLLRIIQVQVLDK
jgi:hypothetical protein